MKVAVAQINPVIGDVEGNADAVVRAAARAKEMSSDLVIFPEMCLTGYPPRDLLLRPGVVERNLNALADVAKRVGTACIVGYVDKNPLPEGRPLYNAAAILDEGQIQYISYKSHLPRFEYFDQTRYFEPAVGLSPTKFRDKRMVITIGEDLWDDPTTGLGLEFPKPLLADTQKKKPELVVNLAAIPYSLGLDHKRAEILKRQASAFKVPVIMSNQVGASGDLVFDGSSLAVSAGGEAIARGKAFQEDLIFVDLVYGAGDIHEEDRPDHEMLYRAAILAIRDYATKAGFRRALLRLSGDLNSAVLCCAALEALGRENVIGALLGSGGAGEEDALRLASELGVKTEAVDVRSVVERAATAWSRPLEGGTSRWEANLLSRMNGVALLYLSNRTGALVLSSADRSQMALGAPAAYGEHMLGYAPFGDIPGRVLQAIAAEVVNREKAVLPTSVLSRRGDGEGTDDILAALLDDSKSPEELLKTGADKAVVEKVLHRIERGEWKALQKPLSPKLFSSPLQPARRIPVASKR